MKLSIGTFVYVNYSIGETIERVSNLGYDGIELSAASEFGRAYPANYSKEKRREVVKMAKDHGLEISSYNPELRPTLGLCLAHPSVEVRNDTISFICDAVRMAKDLEAKVVVVVPGRALYGVDPTDAWRWSVEGLRKCVELAEKEGVILGLEHLTLLEGNIVCTLSDITRMIQEVGSENLKAVIDTGHVNVMSESLMDYVGRLGSKIAHVHWDNNDGRLDSHDPPHVGTMHFGAFFRELKRINYSGHVSVEMGFLYTTDPDTPAEMSKRLYDRLLAEAGN
jgi:protein FrlC